jgi:hypothetical protein
MQGVAQSRREKVEQLESNMLKISRTRFLNSFGQAENGKESDYNRKEHKATNTDFFRRVDNVVSVRSAQVAR